MTEIIALIVAAFLVFADQLSKYLITLNYNLYQSKTIISGILNFTYTQNSGAAFGILENQRWVFMSVTSIVILAGLVALAMRKIKSKWLIWSAALVISGGIGNMIDRIGRSYVVDFIDVQFVKFYIFNIADCCVVIGAFMMMAYFIRDTIIEHKTKTEIEKTDMQKEEKSENG